MSSGYEDSLSIEISLCTDLRGEREKPCVAGSSRTTLEAFSLSCKEAIVTEVLGPLVVA